MPTSPDIESTAPADERTGAPEDSGEVRAAVFRAAVAHLFEQAHVASAVNIVLAILVVITLWSSAPPSLLLAWSGALIAVNLLRIGLAFAYWRTEARAIRPWYARFVAGMVASSGLWGLAGPLFLPLVPPMETLALALAIGGIAAGGLPLLGAVLPVYLAHIAVALGPGIATFVVFASYTDLLLALMITLFASALAASGRAYSRNIHDAHVFGARLDEANQALEWRASHDPLTGLWNRHRFDSELDEELGRAERYGTPCSLIMLDVDHFKAINDACGHDVGDRVLAHVGHVLANAVRAPDHVARWGGEEFMVLLPQTTLAAATGTAERLRARIAEAVVPGGHRCTASLGVAACAAPDQRASLLKRLDDALYRAKENGRNRVCALSEPEWRAPA